MKKNLVLVLGLVSLLYTSVCCETDDELNSLKNIDLPIKINKQKADELQTGTLNVDQVESLSCDDLGSTTLYVNKDLEVGLVHISNSENELFVTYDLRNTSWSLAETHLYVGAEENMPFSSGVPQIGEFPYHSRQKAKNTKEYTFTIPRSELDTCLVIIAHAVVQRDDQAGQIENAFGFGYENSFPGDYWGWFIDYCMQECGDEGKYEDEFEDIKAGSSPAGDLSHSDWAADCLESFAYNAAQKEDSHCFLSSGFDHWGWTNQVFYSQQMNYASGYVQSFPLLASAYQCDIRNSLEVGYLTLRVTGKEGDFQAEVEVTITDQTYDLNAFDLYIGTQPYPLDDNLKPTLSPEHYTHKISSIESKTFSMSEIPWPVNANFIAKGILCPAQ